MQADETIGENHLRLSSALSDIAEGLASLLKDTDRARRNVSSHASFIGSV
jgi:hypothetical protein